MGKKKNNRKKKKIIENIAHMLNFFCPLLGLNRIGKTKNENFFFLCRKKLENSSIAFSKFVCFV